MSGPSDRDGTVPKMIVVVLGVVAIIVAVPMAIMYAVARIARNRG